MCHGPRSGRHSPYVAHPVLALAFAGLIASVPAMAQDAQPSAPQDQAVPSAGAAPADATPQAADSVPVLPGEAALSPLAPMAEEPGIGVDWPDMGQPDAIAPILAEPGDAPPEAIAPPEGEDVQTATDGSTEPGEARVEGAAEQRYETVLNGLDGIMDDQFKLRFNELSVLKQGEGKAANLAQINRRIKEDSSLLDRMLRAKGYYDARIRGGVTSDSAKGRLRAAFDIVPGTLYLLESVDLMGLETTGERQERLRAAFPVHVGDPVDADRITAAQASLTTALGENGYPFAKVEDPTVRVDHDSRKGDLDMIIATGGYRTFGNIILTDNRLFSARHIQRIARFDPGDTYMASDVEDLRKALVATGLVSSVTLTPKDAGDGEHVDLSVDMSPAPPRTIAGEVGYGTGEGFRVEGSWQHRNFFPPEGALTLRGVAGTQEQLASATYRRNNFKKRDQVLTGVLSAANSNFNAYDARTLLAQVTLERQTNIVFQKKWVWSVGAELVASDERDSFSKIAGGGRRTFLIGALPVGLTYDGSDDLLNPSSGFRLGGRLSPELSFQDGTFGYVRAQVDGSIYQPMTDRVVIAARTRLGSIFGSSSSRIAPSRRFYAGGGGSVRGYGYQDIGPRDVNNDPIGGKSLAEFSLEARVRFGNFGVVPFVDAGNISTSFLPRFRDLRIGAGMGVRYYSNFGPIRVDIGTPVNPQKGDPRVAVYVSLGQAF
jgi:translocation and assembly module TamA